MLKDVVDWCGCSPLALLHEDEKLALQRSLSRATYVARKFESLIDVGAVARAERQALRFEPTRIVAESPVFDAVWLNYFDARYDNGKTRVFCFWRLIVLQTLIFRHI